MTKSTIKTVLAGGGLLATWLAVTPNTNTPAGSKLADVPRGRAAHVVTVDDLSLQESRLRQHLGAMPLRPAGRNPFRFGNAGASEPRPQAPAPPAVMAPAAVVFPSMSLSGIATDAGPRTSILPGDRPRSLP